MVALSSQHSTVSDMHLSCSTTLMLLAVQAAIRTLAGILPAPCCSLAVPHSLQVLMAPTLRDESGRRSAFANAAALTRGTRGKGIILSSGARQAFELRGPYDVANLGMLFGLTETNAKASLFKALAALRAHQQLVRCRRL